MSSEFKILYSLPFNLTSVPPYLLISTRSPFLTSNGTFLPLSSVLPVPSAMMRPSVGFSFAVSGMMMPPFLTSFSSTGSTSTRSPSGFRLTDIRSVSFCWFDFHCRIKSPRTRGGKMMNYCPVHPLVREDRLLLLIHDFGVDDWAIVLFARIGFARVGLRLAAWTCLAGLRFLGSRFVEFGRYGLPGLVELLAGGFDGGGGAALERVFGFANRFFNPGFIVAREFVRIVLEHLLGAIHRIVRLVAGFNFLALLAVLLGMGFCVFAHLLDFFLRQSAAGRDGDLLLLAGAKVFRAHVQNTVRIDVESDFNLWHAARCRRNVGQMKLADGLVVTGQRTFALEHV